MGKNKFENFVFSITVCFMMVTGMTIYNVILFESTTTDVGAAAIATQFLAIFCIAFAIDWFLVAPIVKKVVSRSTNEQTPFIKKIVMISGLMVLFMCAAMSGVATLLHGYQGSFWLSYANTFATNLIFALPLQFVLVGPVVRAVFLIVFPHPMPETS